MKIFYLSRSTIPSTTANSVHVMKMCAAFAANGHEVVLLAHPGKGAGDRCHELYGVPSNFRLVFGARRWLKANKLQSFLFKLKAARIIKDWQPDLIYSRNPKALATQGSTGTPFVLEEHRVPEKSKRKSREFLFHQPNFRRLVLISRLLKEDYRQQFPILEKKDLLVAHDGADLPRDSTDAPPEIPGEFKVGYIGHLYPGKGMEVIAQLLERCRWATFHIVGGRAQELEMWKNRLSGEPNIVFHGFVPHKKTCRYLEAFDVLLAPFQAQVSSEGGAEISRWMSPLKIFEYMAAGKAILASDLPVLREVLSHGVNALLIPPEDPEKWASALQQLREEKPLRIRLGEQALIDFREKHTWQKRAEAVIQGLTGHD